MIFTFSTWIILNCNVIHNKFGLLDLFNDDQSDQLNIFTSYSPIPIRLVYTYFGFNYNGPDRF